MRVLWWTHEFWPSIGGAEVIGAQLARGLQARGHELGVVTQAGEDLAERDSYFGIPVARFPYYAALEKRDPAAIVSLQQDLRDHLHAFGPDLVHLHTLAYPAFFCSRAMAGSATPLLVTRHDLFPSDPEGGALAPHLLDRADWVACCSRAVLEDVRRRFPEVTPRSSAILNGMPPPALPQHPVPSGPPVLLCVGRLTEQKGFGLAIEAFSRIRGRFPGVRLVVAGEGPAAAALRAEASRLGVTGAVEFPGWIAPAEVPAAIRKAAVVLVPSLGGEAFGLVALQAAQMERPVVASRTGGLPEVVEDGETGFLFEPGDPAGLAEAVATLLGRPGLAEAFGRKGRARALERFTGERYLDEYDTLYREMARSRPGASNASPRPVGPDRRGDAASRG
jgi:glycosyltransferase involved in cell wall biosynthesis